MDEYFEGLTVLLLFQPLMQLSWKKCPPVFKINYIYICSSSLSLCYHQNAASLFPPSNSPNLLSLPLCFPPSPRAPPHTLHSLPSSLHFVLLTLGFPLLLLPFSFLLHFLPRTPPPTHTSPPLNLPFSLLMLPLPCLKKLREQCGQALRVESS